MVVDNLLYHYMLRGKGYCLFWFADQFVECGAGKVLAGLIKRIDRKMPVHNIESPEAFEAAL